MLKCLPVSLFHFNRKWRNFNIESCSCSSSDSMSKADNDSITDDSSGTYCSARSFWAVNICFNNSTMDSVPPDCLQGDV